MYAICQYCGVHLHYSEDNHERTCYGNKKREDNLRTCKYCDKKYSNIQAKNNHEKKCATQRSLNGFEISSSRASEPVVKNEMPVLEAAEATETIDAVRLRRIQYLCQLLDPLNPTPSPGQMDCQRISTHMNILLRDRESYFQQKQAIPEEEIKPSLDDSLYNMFIDYKANWKATQGAWDTTTVSNISGISTENNLLIMARNYFSVLKNDPQHLVEIIDITGEESQSSSSSFSLPTEEVSLKQLLEKLLEADQHRLYYYSRGLVVLWHHDRAITAEENDASKDDDGIQFHYMNYFVAHKVVYLIDAQARIIYIGMADKVILDDYLTSIGHWLPTQQFASSIEIKYLNDLRTDGYKTQPIGLINLLKTEGSHLYIAPTSSSSIKREFSPPPPHADEPPTKRPRLPVSCDININLLCEYIDSWSNTVSETSSNVDINRILTTFNNSLQHGKYRNYFVDVVPGHGNGFFQLINNFTYMKIFYLRKMVIDELYNNPIYQNFVKTMQDNMLSTNPHESNYGLWTDIGIVNALSNRININIHIIAGGNIEMMFGDNRYRQTIYLGYLKKLKKYVNLTAIDADKAVVDTLLSFF